jgi:hypothetical protein
MDTRRDDFMASHARRGGRLTLLIVAVLSLLVIVGLGATLLLDALHSGRRPQALAIVVLSGIALLLGLRFVQQRWWLLRMTAALPPPASEETGIWGVGGPGMRMPGTTQMFGPSPGRRSTDQFGEDPKSR